MKINPFSLYGTDWALLTAQKADQTKNTMTISWGSLGHLWNKDVATVFVRPQRYTQEFMQEADYFSISFFNQDYHQELRYLGTVSGRDEDKISKSKLRLVQQQGIPYFQEAKLVIFCRKLYVQRLEADKFHDLELRAKIYPKEDYHYLYQGEVIAVKKP